VAFPARLHKDQGQITWTHNEEIIEHVGDMLLVAGLLEMKLTEKSKQMTEYTTNGKIIVHFCGPRPGQSRPKQKQERTMKAYLIATDESLASKMDTMDEHGNPMTDSLSPYLNRADAEHAVDNYNKEIPG